MSCRTNCCKNSLIFALLALAILAAPAFAQNCLQDEYTLSGGGKLTCTAGDVRIAAVQNVQVIGGVGNKCLAGQPFSFVADFEILTTSKSSRSNIGLYFGTGQNNALTGTCTDSIIAPIHPCANSNFTCGTAQYAELDPPPDTCGDTSSTDSSPAFGAGTEDVKIEVDNVTCPLSGNSLSLPECSSWQVPGKQLLCESPAPSFPFSNQAVPGSPSKCTCGFLSIPVQPIVPTVSVAKACSVGGGANSTSCDAGAETHDVVYTVTITNTTPAQEGGVIVDQICDNRYGQIYPTSGGTCAAGTVGTISSTTCPPSPNDIANGGSGSCTFTVSHGENLSVTDTVTVAGHSDLAPTALFGPTSSNPVTVTSEDAPSSATIIKGLVAVLNDCATVRFGVDVHNTSGFDETLTLSKLTDSAYGQIIPSTAPDIIATSCSVPQQIAPGADYSCTFDAQFCGVPGPVEEFGTGVCTSGTCTAGKAGSCTVNSDCDLTCPLGISHTNTVSSGTITSDEPGVVVTETDHQLIVNECLASFTQSN